MPHIPRPPRQRGYLLEVPVLLLAMGMVLAVLLPRLEPTGQKALVGFAAPMLLFGIYYMTVVPGWTPGGRRLPAPWNWILFALVALTLLTGAGLFILS